MTAHLSSNPPPANLRPVAAAVEPAGGLAIRPFDLVKLHLLWLVLASVASGLAAWTGAINSMAWSVWGIAILPAMAGLWLAGSARPQSGVGLLAGAWVMVGTLGIAASGGVASPLTVLLVIAPLSVICLGRRDAAIEVSAFAILGYALAILSVELDLMPRSTASLGNLPLYLTLSGVLQAGAYAAVAGVSRGRSREPSRAQAADALARFKMEGAPGEFTLDQKGVIRLSTPAGASRLGLTGAEIGRFELRTLIGQTGQEAVRIALARPGAGFARVSLARQQGQMADLEFGPIATDGNRKVHVTLFQPAPPVAAVALSELEAGSDARERELKAALARSTALQQETASLRAEAERQAGRAESAEAALANRSLFFAQMTHEFRTPLAAIQSFTEVIETGFFGQINERYRDYAQMIRQASRSMQILVDDVLDLSRVEAGRYEASLEPLDPHEICVEVARFMHDIAAQSQVRIVVEASETGLEVMVDRYALNQVLVNLVSNAIKAMRQGGEVALRVTRKSPQTVRISVGDTGEGMTAEELARVMQAFEQAGRIDKRMMGYGLGLSVVQRLCEVMHARFSIDSTRGLGTMASLDLVSTEANPAARSAPVRAEALERV
jgi:signal transduction histidine kinase